MRVLTYLVSLLAGGVLLAGCGYEPDADWHPMVDEVQGMPMCGPESPLNAFEKRWFCGFLRGIGDRDLPWGLAESTQTYRLLFLPSDATSLVVRVDVLPVG